MKRAQSHQQDLFQGEERAQGVLNRDGQRQVKELLEELLRAVLNGEAVEREKAHE